MSTPSFCYLAAPDKGLATLEHEGARFVPLFARPADLLAFCGRCKEQLDGYDLYVVTDAAEATRFLAALRDLALQVGISDAARKEGTTETTFAILKPDVLARAFGDGATEGVAPQSRASG